MIRILLVEDEPTLQVATARAIRRTIPGAHVEVVDTAIAAIAAIAREMPALIVSDFDLADGSKGGEVLAYITDAAPSLLPRFLFVSGNELVADLHSRVLMKPCATSELAATLREMLAATEWQVAA